MSWQSDLGGNSWLELAMALETVERTDEARKIYGKLIAISWSPSIRRNALALVLGLSSHTLSIHPHTPSQFTVTHTLNMLSYIFSMHPHIPSQQHTLAQEQGLDIAYQYTLSTHPLNTLSYIYSMHPHILSHTPLNLTYLLTLTHPLNNTPSHRCKG